MIKCPECREEFSYGRRICCCNSNHFGAIFENERNQYQWNCNIFMGIKNSKLSTQKVLSNKILKTKEVNIEEKKNYQWNCVFFLKAIEIASK